MNIKELFENKEIDSRLYNLCRLNNLWDLNSILNHYKTFNGFLNLKNIGVTLNDKLVNFAKSHLSTDNGTSLSYFEEDVNEKVFNLTKENVQLIDEYLEIKFCNLSERSKNAISHYFDEKINYEVYINKIFSNSFFNPFKLRNVGSKSVYEIKIFVFEINDLIQRINIGETNFEFEKKYINEFEFIEITRNQMKALCFLFDNQYNKLSIRVKNAINFFLNKTNIDFNVYYESFIKNKKIKVINIKNLGVKSSNELLTFNDWLHKKIYYISSLNENEIENIIFKNIIDVKQEIQFPENILKSESIFCIVDFLIRKNAFLKKNEKIIFQKSFKIYNNQPKLSLFNIMTEANISKERFRQIRKNIIKDLFSNLQLIRNINENFDNKYNIDFYKNCILIDDELMININKINSTNFSKEFISYIIYVYKSDSFTLLGNIEDVLLFKNSISRDRYNWKCFYLIKNEIYKIFQFNDFAQDLDKRLSDRIKESYYFNFKSYVLSFINSNNLDLIDIVTDVAENILNNEFGIYVDTAENIKFSRNSQKQVFELAFEALKSLGKPSSVNEITNKIIELHPDYSTNDSKISAAMKRKYGFVPIGRRSIFGLKKWENELENFKGGTIRSIVFEYLDSEIAPKHISEIAKYVLIYRPNTYERSILDNLKADETSTFIFFKNSTVGLQSKKYDDSFYNFYQIDVHKKKWEDRYNDLEQFISLNKRLPFSSGSSNEEMSLYRWYKVQKQKIKNGKLESEKCNLISTIIIQFN
jgi:hypothetical protein